MKILNFLFMLFMIFAFCAGVYVIMNDTFRLEPMTNASPYYCSDTLIEKDGFILLYNSNTPDDHITFNNLEEYNTFVQTQREQGINCPVLTLQTVVVGSGIDTKPVIDSSDDHYPFNKESYPSYDPYGLQIGVYTDLDKVHNSFNYKQLTHETPKWKDIETSSANYDANVLSPSRFGDTPLPIFPYGSSDFSSK